MTNPAAPTNFLTGEDVPGERHGMKLLVAKDRWYNFS